MASWKEKLEAATGVKLEEKEGARLAPWGRDWLKIEGKPKKAIKKGPAKAYVPLHSAT